MIRACVWFLVAAALCGGCTGAQRQSMGMGRSSKVGPPVVERVDGLNLWAGAMSADLDGVPGADGVSVRLTLYQIAGGKVRPVAGSNSVELLLYEGEIRGRDVDRIEPLLSVPLAAEEMQPFLSRYYGLWCYEMSIQWKDKTPQSATVTALARYRSPDGSFLYSAPTTVKVR